MATVVSTPDGGRWRVGRRWAPWRFRMRKPRSPLDDIGGIDDIDDIGLPLAVGGVVGGPFVIVGVVAAILVAALAAVPVLLAVFELTILAVLAAAGVVARMLLRRPWIVDVERLDAHDGGSWEVVGWRRSGELVTALATQLQSGQPLKGLPDAVRC